MRLELTGLVLTWPSESSVKMSSSLTDSLRTPLGVIRISESAFFIAMAPPVPGEVSTFHVTTQQ